MAKNSVLKPLDLINRQIDAQERLSEYLGQAVAMFQVALSGDFLAFNKATIHYYLLAIDDIVIRARNFNDQLLSDWAWIIRVLSSQGPSSSGTKH